MELRLQQWLCKILCELGWKEHQSGTNLTAFRIFLTTDLRQPCFPCSQWRLTALPGWAAIVPWREVAGLKMLPNCLRVTMSWIFNFPAHGCLNYGTWGSLHLEVDLCRHQKQPFPSVVGWWWSIYTTICSAGTSLIQGEVSQTQQAPARTCASSLRTQK